MTISKLLQHHGIKPADADKLESEYLADREPAWDQAERRAEHKRRRLEAAAAKAAEAERALIEGVSRALKPFSTPLVEPKHGWKYPRAGVRPRPDGKWQLRIWLDAHTPDPIQGGPQETLLEALNLGAMICHYAREAAL